MKQAFWKIPKEWVLEWGLTANEAILLADIVAWPTCSVDERATRIGKPRQTVYNLLDNLQKCQKILQVVCKESLQHDVKKFDKKCKKSLQKSVKNFDIPPHPPIKKKKNYEEQ